MGTALGENLRFYGNFVIGKPAVLLELRYWKTCGFMGTALGENLRFYWKCVRGAD
jgi:hypothetical protein